MWHFAPTLENPGSEGTLGASTGEDQNIVYEVPTALLGLLPILLEAIERSLG